MIVTIDGPAGTGKSTVAKLLAKKLGFSFFDTGALYRAFAYWVLDLDIKLDNLGFCIENFLFRIEEKEDKKQYFVGSKEVTDLIRSKNITEKASQFAAIADVRRALLPIQRAYAHSGDFVFEGRDTGSVVFPEAEAKIFLLADPMIRASRRYKEFRSKNPSDRTTLEEFFHAMQARDAQDEGRKIAPLVCPEGAMTLDTTLLTIDEVIDKLEKYVLDKKRQCKGG